MIKYECKLGKKEIHEGFVQRGWIMCMNIDMIKTKQLFICKEKQNINRSINTDVDLNIDLSVRV